MEDNYMNFLNAAGTGHTIEEVESKLKQYFSDMIVYKTPSNSKFFSSLSLPSFMRDWLVMRFSDEEGRIDKEEVSSYIKRTIPNKEQWNDFQVELLHNNQSVRFLTKVKIDFDTANRQALFSLPEFGVPQKKGEAVVEWHVIEENREYLLSPTEVWGIVEILCDMDDSGKKNIISWSISHHFVHIPLIWIITLK